MKRFIPPFPTAAANAARASAAIAAGKKSLVCVVNGPSGF
jgi:hypothetical protein